MKEVLQMKIEKMYTIREVTEILGVHQRTVYRYITEKRLKAAKLKQWRIKESDLQAFINGGEANEEETEQQL